MLSLPPHIVQDQISKIFTDPMEFTLTKEEGQANNVNFLFFLSLFFWHLKNGFSQTSSCLNNDFSTLFFQTFDS